MTTLERLRGAEGKALKKCSQCNIIKPVEEVYCKSSRETSVRSPCKDCKKKRARVIVTLGWPHYSQRLLFWARTLPMPNGCWEWQSYKSPDGYGRLHWEKQHWASAYRVAYNLVKGLIPSGLVIDHLCRNPSCVNPNHLEAVTNQVNVLRGIGPSANHAKKTHCIHGHEFSQENTIRRKKGWRGCRICARQAGKKCYAKKKWGSHDRANSTF